MNRIAWVVGLVLLLGTACQTKQAYPLNRPQTPWALRSVLDYQPRMLTLALDSNMYAAYDLEHCGLYKAWKGGVNWDGIVYNDTKSLQPTSWGADYFTDEPSTGSWWFADDTSKIQPEVRFKGYRFENGHIFLRYTLSAGHDSVQIEERPEYVESTDGSPGLERKFIRTGNSSLSVYLHTQSQEVKVDPGASVMLTYFPELPEQQPPADFETSEGQTSGVKARYWLAKSDCFTCHEYSGNSVGPGFKEIAEKYAETDQVVEYLTTRVQEGGSGVWGNTPMNSHPDFSREDLELMVRFILSLDRQHDHEQISEPEVIEVAQFKPGHGAALEGVHPSYDLTTLSLPGYEFTVGGMAFFPDGRLLVATWSPEGSVYILDNLDAEDSSKIQIKLMAQGLAETLGAAVVDNRIFVLQKQELTELLDHDGDEITDEYRVVCNSFGVSADFHEFAFGLVFKEGHFYANLSLPMRLMANERPHPDRGRTIRIAMDGSFEHINHGLRQPNGIGIGVDGEIFITDNQGQWLPGNKLIHLQNGAFYGMRWGLPDSLMEIPEVAPTVWLPQSEIGNSPSEPTIINDGPYAGQMLHGDITHGGIKRVFLEKIKGEYQGVVFRFSQGLMAGVNRLRWGPDGALYIGQAGMIGGWSWKGFRSGLQRVKYNGNSTFEILAIRLKDKGFEIEFTEPLASGTGNSVDDYLVQQWWYLPTASYGGPKMDLETLKITNVAVSEDRKTVHLNIPGVRQGRVVYFKLNEVMESINARSLWSSEAWYTLNNFHPDGAM